jgi:hypothetical protein
MATYYVNKFNQPNTDNWHFAVWEVERDERMKYRKWYIWVKMLYDPQKQFNKGYTLDPNEDVVANDEHELISKIFWSGSLKGIKAKR